MTFAFAGRHDQAALPAEQLAEKLSRSMDRRSFSGLFLAAAYRTRPTDDAREVALWVFPEDEVIQFETQQNRIAVVRNAFSRTSQQRKLALLRGRNVRGQFHTADVLDFQSRGRVGALAAFWMDEFLEADALLSDIAGTRFLADVFVDASAKLKEPSDLDQIQAAVIALRHGPVQTRSVDEVANELLEGDARDEFVQAAQKRLPNSDARRTRFRLNREEFAATVGYRMFRTRSGAQVIAPLEHIGDTWSVEERPAMAENDQAELVLRLEDVVVKDKLRRGSVN